MTYCIGLFVIIFITYLAQKLARFSYTFSHSGIFSFFKLHYLAYGFIITWFFPKSFLGLVEQNMGIVLTFCVSWIGFFYGCSLEIRSHEKYSPKTLLFHIIEPFILFAFAALTGTLYVYSKSNDIKSFDSVIIAAIFVSITLYKRPEASHCNEKENPYRTVLNDLLPLRNILGVSALCLIGIFMHGSREVVLFGHHFTGMFAVFAFHVLCGLSAGVVFSLLLGGTGTSDSLSTVSVGAVALLGGIAYTLSFSPLFVGIIAGTFLINSTLKRLQVIETISICNEYIEIIFLFSLGALLSFEIKRDFSVLSYIIPGALGIVILRGALKYLISFFWVSIVRGYRKGVPLLWIGLTGQGMLAAGVAVDFRLYQSHKPFSLFLLLAVMLILHEIITGLFILKTKRRNS